MRHVIWRLEDRLTERPLTLSAKISRSLTISDFSLLRTGAASRPVSKKANGAHKTESNVGILARAVLDCGSLVSSWLTNNTSTSHKLVRTELCATPAFPVKRDIAKAASLLATMQTLPAFAIVSLPQE